MIDTDNCPLCGAAHIGVNYWGCGSDPFFQSDRCKERAELAATKRELEDVRAKVKKFEPYYLDYISSVSAAGLPADGPCLACNGFGGHEEGCHGTTGLMTMAYELETLRARVRELEAELRQSFELAEGQLQAEKLAGNIVKEEFWKGELAALHRMRRVLGEAIQGGAK